MSGLTSANRIPSRIIQTGKSVDSPLIVKAAIANVRLLNPDFEYLFFDDEAVARFFADECPQYRRTFESFTIRIQKYDFFRYVAVHRYGGFYFDLDVLLAMGLTPLLTRSAVFPFEGLTFSRYLRDRLGTDWQIGNYAFGAEAGSAFVGAVIENCIRAQREPAWVAPMMQGVPWLTRSDFFVLNTTGPGLLTRTLVENTDLARSVTVLFPEDVCDTSTWNRFGHFGIHMMDGSWRDRPTGFLRRRLATHLEDRRMRKLVGESAALGRSRALQGQDSGQAADVHGLGGEQGVQSA
jgi:hypothetical protein